MDRRKLIDWNRLMKTIYTIFADAEAKGVRIVAHRFALKASILGRRRISDSAVFLIGWVIVLAGCSSVQQYTNLSVAECTRTARLAMRDSDFTQNLLITHYNDGSAVISGEHGGYRGRIYCAPGQRTVEVTGADIKEVDYYVDYYKNSIIRRF